MSKLTAFRTGLRRHPAPRSTCPNSPARGFSRRGDTLIEVSIAISVFCIISIVSIGLMDSDLSAVQGALELNMARNEIDAQAEAIRFVHDSYLSERNYAEGSQQYKEFWNAIKGAAVDSVDAFTEQPCANYYADTSDYFILNTRALTSYPNDTNPPLLLASNATDATKFTESSLYPRVIFGTATDNTDTQLLETTTNDKILKAEGIWVLAAKADNSGSEPQFYDFHIRTCWYAPGHNVPSTIATIIRLYNPAYKGGS